MLKPFALACATAVFAFGAAAAELKFANFASPAHTVNAAIIEKLNATLSAETGGALTVRGYHGGELGSGPAEQYVRVVQGVADMAWGLPGYTSSQFPKTMIVEMPGVLPEDKPGYDALWDAFETHLSAEFPGTVPLALWTSEPNIIIMRDQDVRAPSDFQGLRIRVAGATAGDVVEAMGGTPVQMPISQVYNALQTGLIDGVITVPSTVLTFKLDEVASSYALGAPLGRLSFFTVMNAATYAALPADQRAALDAIRGRPLSQSAEEGYLAAGSAGIAAARAAGNNTVIDLSSEEIDAFEAALQDVTAAYVDAVGGAEVLATLQQ
ncbi:MAG: TRAP transporter substrate-binding protein [Pseudomonadota bacterium]